MKRISTLLIMLLMVCMGAGADGTITVSTAEGGWTANGTYYDYYNTGWSTNWYSNSSALTISCSPTYYMTTGGVLANATYNMNLPLGKITRYSISFKLHSDKTKVKITAADGTTNQETTSTDTPVTLNVTGLSTPSTTFTVSDGWADVTAFSVTYDNTNSYEGMYRIKSNYTSNYVYSNDDNINRMMKMQSSATVSTYDLFASADYRWKVKRQGLNVTSLQNVGTTHYAAAPTTASGGGSEQTVMSVTEEASAESFSVLSRRNYATEAIALKSSSGCSTSTTVFLNGFRTNDDYVGWHSSPHDGDVFIFIPLKKVTFSSAVAVNGGVAVSTIYVATDGSDAANLSLPSGYLYSVNGATEVSNTLAAAAIAAAGTSDVTVTVNEEAKNATARITNNKLYRIYTYNNGTTDGSTKYYLTSTGYLTADEASAGDFLFTATTEDHYINAGYAWRITANNGTNYFSNSDVVKDNHIHLAGSNNKRQNWEAQVFYWNGSKYAVRSTNSTNGSGYRCEEFWTVKADATSDGVPEADYDATINTKHYVWEIEVVGSVTFNLLFQDETIRTKVVNRASVLGTAALPDESWNNACCAYSYSPSTIDDETETVNVTMTWNVGDGLIFSSDYASATWYYLSLRDKWAKYTDTNSKTILNPLYSDKGEVRYTDEGLWAFVGNPIDGVRLFNKAAGSSKCMLWTSGPYMGSTSDGNAVYWKLGKHNDNKFYLYYEGFYLHDKDEANYLDISKSYTTVGGSAFEVSALDWRDKAVYAVQDYGKSHALGEYFGTDEALMNTTTATIKNFAGDFTEAMYNTVTSDYSGLIKYPSTGYYRVKSSGKRAAGETYITYGYSSDASKYGLVTTPVANKYTDAGTIVKLTTTATTGVYTLSLQGLNVQDETGYDTPFTATESDGATFVFEPLSAGVVGIRHNTSDDYAYLHEADWTSPSAVVRWETSAPSQWTVEDAATLSDGAYALTVNMNTVGDNTYATLYLPFGVTIDNSSDVDAYIMAISGDYAVGTKIGKNIPANTGVMLKGTATSVNLAINDEATATTTGNELVGTNVATTARVDDEGVYDLVLGLNNGELGFYKAPSATLAANKAYLPYTPGASTRVGFSLKWDDDVTGISDAELKQKAESRKQMYDLQGRRVQNPQHGLYIVNGKKVVIK